MNALAPLLAALALLGLQAGPALAGAGAPVAPRGAELVSDLDGDGKAERAWLEASGPVTEGYWPGAALLVSPGTGGNPRRMTLGDSLSGYQPMLTALPDGRLLLQAATGGSGGRANYAIVGYAGGRLRLLASAEPPRGLPALAAKFEPGYRLSVTIPGLGTRRVDISGRKALYEAQGVYKKGQLTPQTPAVWGTERPDGLVVGADGQLEARYSLRGFAEADRPARVTLFLAPSPEGYAPKRAEISAEPLE